MQMAGTETAAALILVSAIFRGFSTDFATRIVNFLRKEKFLCKRRENRGEECRRRRNGVRP